MHRILVSAFVALLLAGCSSAEDDVDPAGSEDELASEEVADDTSDAVKRACADAPKVRNLVANGVTCGLAEKVSRNFWAGRTTRDPATQAMTPGGPIWQCHCNDDDRSAHVRCTNTRQRAVVWDNPAGRCPR